MRVFLSWSGEKSRVVARALRQWLPDVINAVEPFMSEEDIEKGTRGLDEITGQLQGSDFGIICLTRANVARQWINFEAGALSRSLDQPTHVATLLIDLDGPAEVTGPLAAFQATKLHDTTDVKRLVLALARAAGDKRTPERLDAIVDRLWPELASEIDPRRLDAAEDDPTGHPHRTMDDKVDEILAIARRSARPISGGWVYQLPDQAELLGARDARAAAEEQQQRRRIEQAIRARTRQWGFTRDEIGVTFDGLGNPELDLYTRPITQSQFDELVTLIKDSFPGIRFSGTNGPSTPLNA